MDCDKLEFLSFYFPRPPPVELLKNSDGDEETGGRWAEEKQSLDGLSTGKPRSCLKGAGGNTDGWGGVREVAGRGAGSCGGERDCTPSFTKRISQVGTVALTRQCTPSSLHWDLEDVGLAEWKGSSLASQAWFCLKSSVSWYRPWKGIGVFTLASAKWWSQGRTPPAPTPVSLWR